MSDGCARTLLEDCYCVFGSMALVVFELFERPYCFAEGTRFIGCFYPSKLSRDLLLLLPAALSKSGPFEAFLVVEDSRHLFWLVSLVFCAELVLWL